MNRREFTKNISTLIIQMIKDGNEPVIDYCLRSQDEQVRLYNKGFSKLDGIIKISAHQKALAMDIYFVVTNPDLSVEVDFNCDKTADLHKKYHDVWVSMGGKPIIESPTFRDLDHYEG